MAEFKRMILTNKGQTALTQLISNSKTINFFKICSSSDIFTNDEILALNNLTNIKQTISVTQVKVLNISDVKISVTISNEGLTTGYDLNSIGLFIKNENDEEILYSVASVENAEKGIYIPANNGSVSTQIDLDIITTIANADNVSFNINPTGFASKEEVEELDTKINNNVLKSYTTTLTLANWTLNSTTSKYEYNVTNANITVNHYVEVIFDIENQEKFSDKIGIESYNGGFKIISNDLPDGNVTMTVIYQLTSNEVQNAG